MAKLIYAMISSLDLYINDDNGNFDWAAPDAEVHRFINDFEQSIGTYLYGRRLYDVMAAWQTMYTDDEPSIGRDFAEAWRAAEKLVYSTTLSEPSTPKTRIEREFSADAIRQLKQTSEQDISVGGALLASQALKAGLVDECHLYLTPILVGGGTPVFPRGMQMPLELIDERRFHGGMVYIRYRVRNEQPAPEVAITL